MGTVQMLPSSNVISIVQHMVVFVSFLVAVLCIYIVVLFVTFLLKGGKVVHSVPFLQEKSCVYFWY